MVMIRCRGCNRPQMEISSDSTGVIRWKCKSCREWNACEVAQPSPDESSTGLVVRFVGLEGRRHAATG